MSSGFRELLCLRLWLLPSPHLTLGFPLIIWAQSLYVTFLGVAWALCPDGGKGRGRVERAGGEWREPEAQGQQPGALLKPHLSPGLF